MKDSFKVVDNYITGENVNFHFEYIHTPKEIESHLSKFIVYDLETHNTASARPHVFCFYRLSKLAGRYYCDLTPYEYEKSKNDSIVFDGGNCVTNVLDFCLKLKGEDRKVKNKFVDYNFQLNAHNGSGFDTWIFSIFLPCDKQIVNIIKSGK